MCYQLNQFSLVIEIIIVKWAIESVYNAVQRVFPNYKYDYSSFAVLIQTDQLQSSITWVIDIHQSLECRSVCGGSVTHGKTSHGTLKSENCMLTNADGWRQDMETFSAWLNVKGMQQSIPLTKNSRWFTSGMGHHGPRVTHNKGITLRWRHNEWDGVSNHQPHDCLLNCLSGRRSKKTSKPRVTGLCVGNSPVTGEFPAQMASNAETVSIWWRHHVLRISIVRIIVSPFPTQTSYYLTHFTDVLHKRQHGGRSSATVKTNNISASLFNFATVLNGGVIHFSHDLWESHHNRKTYKEIDSHVNNTLRLEKNYYNSHKENTDIFHRQNSAIFRQLG